MRDHDAARKDAGVRLGVGSQRSGMTIAVLAVTAGSPAAAGGSAPGVPAIDLALALARAGHEVTVWTRRTAVDQPEMVALECGARIRYLAAGPPRPMTDPELLPVLPEFAAAMRAAWSTERPDVVHARSRLSGLVMLTAARGTGISTVQSFPPGGPVRGSGPVDGCLVSGVDQVITTSAEMAERLGRLGAARAAVAVLPSGVDAETFCPGGPSEPRAGRPRLVSLSGWEPSTGVDEAVAALARVPQAELVVAGGGSDPHRDRLSALADRCGVRERVQLAGTLSRESTPGLLRSSDIVVCVPWFEHPDTAALEAMACARPVVVSAVGGLTDTVIDGITGLHVPAREPRRLATALRELLDRAVLREAFGIAGRDRVLARYSWDRIADDTVTIYRRLVEPRGRG
jgi:D-inositol-3-phosphate glycosyltransferase